MKDRRTAETSQVARVPPGSEEAAARLNWSAKEETKQLALDATPWPETAMASGRSADGACTERASPYAGGPRPAVAAIDFEAVYAQTFQLVWRSLRMLGVGKESLDDALQDVFGAVARQLPGFEGRSSLRTWVFGITQNVAHNHRRSRKRKLERLEPLSDGILSREPTPEAHAEGREAADLVLRFCEELDEERRAVFVLGVLERVPANELAASLSIPVNTVYTRIHALRRALAARLSQREVET
jgi:RNA polymerase sigma-70 factor (ECF subfamily)